MHKAAAMLRRGRRVAPAKRRSWPLGMFPSLLIIAGTSTFRSQAPSHIAGVTHSCCSKSADAKTLRRSFAAEAVYTRRKITGGTYSSREMCKTTQIHSVTRRRSTGDLPEPAVTRGSPKQTILNFLNLKTFVFFVAFLSIRLFRFNGHFLNCIYSTKSASADKMPSFLLFRVVRL